MAVVRVRGLTERCRLRVQPAPAGAPPGTSPTPTLSVYGAARVDASWSALAGATSYALQRSPHAANTWATVHTVTGLAWKDTGLTAATAYDYRVVASVGGTSQTPSATATATTTAAGSIPGYPIEFNANVFSSTQVNVGWSWVAPEPTYYVVQRSPDGVSNWAAVAVVTGSQYSDTGLTPATTYYYRVVGGFVGGEVIDSGDGASGAFGPQTTYAAGAPTLPTYHGLTAAALSPTSVQVRCLPVQAPEGMPCSAYVFERSADGGSTWTQVASQAGTVFVDTGLSATTAYKYRHKAVGAGGTSAASTPVPVTTLAVRSGRALLQPQDFTYLGSFQPPFYVDPLGADVRSSYTQTGHCFRYVGGQLRFLGLTSQAQPNPSFLYEYTPPGTLATSPPFPAGTPVKYWGDPYNGKKLMFYGGTHDAAGSSTLADNMQNGGEFSSACFADPDVANRVWTTWADWYNVAGVTGPSFLHFDLNDGAGTVSTTGPYRFNEQAANAPASSRVKAGFGAIPQWFANAYLNTGGKGTAGDPWRMCGFGGNEAGASGASFGPSVVAFNANRLAGNECLAGDIGNSGDSGIVVVGGDSARHTPVIPSVTMACFPYNTAWATKSPGSTNPGVGSDFKVDSVGLGYYYTLDRIKGGLFWLDDAAGTRAKHGVIVATVSGFGRSAYKGTNVLTGAANGGPACDGGQAFHFTIVDPADLATAAGGGSATVPVTPASHWLADFWNADQRVTAYTGNMGVDTSQSVNGMAFDPATNRLYVCIGHGPPAPGHGEPTPIIHVYQLS